MFRPITLAFVATLSFSLVGEAVARDRKDRVAVVELNIEGDAAPELRVQLDKSLAAGLVAAGYEVIAREEVAQKLRETPQLVGCDTTTCLAKIGDIVGARLFVRGRVEAAGAAYTMQLDLLAADAPNALLRHAEKSCPVCTLDEANAALIQVAGSLRDPSDVPVPVHVRTSPPGASVTIDGKPVGRAPVDLQVPPGPHSFEAFIDVNYEVTSTRVTVSPQEGDKVQDVVIRLAAVEKPGLPPPPRPFRYGAWRWVAAGAGVAALAGGAWLLILDGNGSDCPFPMQPCREVYDTLVPGLALTAVGVGLGGLAVYMVLHDRKAVAPALVPVPGGAAIQLFGRF